MDGGTKVYIPVKRGEWSGAKSWNFALQNPNARIAMRAKSGEGDPKKYLRETFWGEEKPCKKRKFANSKLKPKTSALTNFRPQLD